MKSMGKAAAVATMVLVAGCLQPSSRQCDDGRTCPADATCDVVNHLCATTAQRSACLDHIDGNTCAYSNTFGVCNGGTCLSTMWTATAVIDGNTKAMSVVLASPVGVAVDRLGNVYIADETNDRIWRLDPMIGVIAPVAGNGTAGSSGDGGAATSAQLHQPTGVAVDGLGDLYIVDQLTPSVRRVDATTGVITTVAGTGTLGFSGDGGVATSAQLFSPSGVAVDGVGDVYIADQYNDCVRRVDVTTGVITTVAGHGHVIGFSGDGGAATSALLAFPAGVAVDGLGDLYIADSGNGNIRRVDVTTGIITTVAGNGIHGFSGDGGPATSAQLDQPTGLVVDGLGDLYIADSGNGSIRRVDATTGIITTVAGTGILGFSGDGGAATSAKLDEPWSVAVDGRGDLYIAETQYERIRRVDATGVITTVAGNGTKVFSGDGGGATCAQFHDPSGVAVDGRGDLYIADAANRTIRRVDVTTGVITTVAGSGTTGFSGDGGLATRRTARARRRGGRRARRPLHRR